MPINLGQRVKAAYQQFRHPNNGFNGQLSFGKFFNLQREKEFKTDLGGNSAVVACMEWITRNFHQAQIRIVKENMDGKRKPITSHPLLDVLYAPNNGYGRQALWTATLVSYHLDGNGYWIKVKDGGGFGNPVQFWYVPHWMMKPKWDKNSTQFISHYEYRVNGETFRVEVEDVVHFRNGIDPDNTRKGRAPLKSTFREVFTDDEASVYSASILKNMGVPGLLITPNDNLVSITPESANETKEIITKRTTGTERGKPVVLDYAAKMERLGFNPTEMALDVVRRVPVERICAVLGIPKSVVGLDTEGNSQSYNNLVNLKKSAFEENLCPTWNNFEEELTRQILQTDYVNSRNVFVEFDTSKIPALKENENDRQKRARDNFVAGGISRNEFRSEIGAEIVEGQDVIYLPSKVKVVTPEKLLEMANQALPDPNAQPDNNPNTPPTPQKKSLNDEQLQLEAEQAAAIEQAQNDAKEALTAILLLIKAGLVSQGIEKLRQLGQEFNQLQLSITADDARKIADAIEKAYRAGAATVAEIITPPNHTDILKLAKILSNALTVGVAAKMVASFALQLTRGLSVAASLDNTSAELADESKASYEALAASTGYQAVASGRSKQAEIRKYKKAYYSTILDKNTCDNCREKDGLWSDNAADLPPVPNPDCKGKWKCRCVHVYQWD